MVSAFQHHSGLPLNYKQPEMPTSKTQLPEQLKVLPGGLFCYNYCYCINKQKPYHPTLAKIKGLATRAKNV
jgi:hypothetical protein